MMSQAMFKNHYSLYVLLNLMFSDTCAWTPNFSFQAGQVGWAGRQACTVMIARVLESCHQCEMARCKNSGRLHLQKPLVMRGDAQSQKTHYSTKNVSCFAC